MSLLGQILSANQQANLLGPIRARLLAAAVDGLSDGQRHPKRDRLQVLQCETCTSEEAALIQRLHLILIYTSYSYYNY